MATIDTGIPELDRDLEVLFEWSEKGLLPRVRAIFEDESVSDEEVMKHVPQEILDLMGVFLFSEEPVLQRVKQGSKDKEVVQKAQRIIETELQVDREKLRPRLEAYVEKEASFEGTGLVADALRVISGISTRFVWHGEPGSIEPAARIVFRDRNDQLLLDSTFDWHTMVYVAGALMSVLERQMEKGKELAEQGHLGLRFKEQIGQRLVSLASTVEKVKALCPVYDIDLEEASEEAPAENQSEE